jgi:hypothetical protein
VYKIYSIIFYLYRSCIPISVIISWCTWSKYT